MKQENTTKRFIAGAKCPECQQMDTTVCYYENDVFVRECIECEFHERIAGDEADKEKPKSGPSPAQIIKITEL